MSENATREEESSPQELNKDRFTFFHKKDAPFSLQKKTHFVVRGKLFTSAEQFLHYQKALLFNDVETAQQILESDTPAEQRRMVKTVKDVDEYRWLKYRDFFVYEGNRAKFMQNADLREELMATRGTDVVEASPTSKIWGIGMGVKNPDIYDPEKWKGENVLGRVLTRLREDIFTGLELNKFMEKGWEAFKEQAAESGRRPEDASAMAELLSECLEQFAHEFEEDPNDKMELLPEEAAEIEIPCIVVRHTTYFDEFYYLIGVVCNRLDITVHQAGMSAYWRTLDFVETFLQDNDDRYLKGYHCCFTDDPYYVENEEEELPPYSTVKLQGIVNGSIKMPGDEEPAIVRGHYNMKKWEEVNKCYFIRQQLHPMANLKH